MNEQLKPRESIFPLSQRSVLQALKEISVGTVDFLNREEVIISRNPNLYRFLMRRGAAADSFLDKTLYKKGAFFTHRVLRLQAQKSDLPQISRDFVERNEAGVSLSYYTRQISRLSREEPHLPIALEAITGFDNILSVVAGAIDVYFPLRHAIQNQ